MHRPTYSIVCFILLVFLFIIVSCNPYSFYLILCHLHVTKIVIISFYILRVERINVYYYYYLFGYSEERLVNLVRGKGALLLVGLSILLVYVSAMYAVSE